MMFQHQPEDYEDFWHEAPPSRIRFAAFWIFTALICVCTLWAVVAAVMRMVGV